MQNININNSYACQFCGGALLTHNGRMGAQCTSCGKYYSADQLYRLASFHKPAEDKSDRVAPIAGIAVIAAVIWLAMIPVAPVMATLLLPAGVIYAAKKIIDSDMAVQSSSEKPVGAAEQLRSADDYLRAFRMLPLDYMPLRAEACRAIAQIDALKRKQIAVASMLEQGHPFIQSCNNAAEYILSNLKQVLYRLKYCDQNDVSLRKMHAEYLRERLDDNDRVLRDFENLIIEVTQMEDQTAVTAPTLDVLAETLHSVRTGDPIPSGAERRIPGEIAFMRGER